MKTCGGASAGVVGVSGRELLPNGTTAMVEAMDVFRKEGPHDDLLCDTDLLEEMGYGWYFTMLAVVGGVLGVTGSQLIRKKGMEWRIKRSASR